MKISKIIQGAIGLYLIMPSIEDVATGGATIAPSVALGAILLADSFGVKLW